MSDLEVRCITDMAAIHQTRASFRYLFSAFTSLLPRAPPLPLSLSVNTTLQLLTQNSGGDKDQPWPSHLQCYSLERKTHKRHCIHTYGHTYKRQAASPPRNIHRAATAAECASTTRSILPRILRTRWAVWLWWCGIRTGGCRSGEKGQHRHLYSECLHKHPQT